MRGLVSIALLAASIAFSHIVVVGAVLALATGVAVIWTTWYYRQHH